MCCTCPRSSKKYVSDPTSDDICVPITSGTRIDNNPTSVGPVDFRVQFWHTHSFVTSNRRTCAADVNCAPSIAGATPTCDPGTKVAGNRVILPPLAILTGIAATALGVPICEAGDHACDIATLEALQALLGDPLTFTMPELGTLE
jgi:hypothetical protein